MKIMQCGDLFGSRIAQAALAQEESLLIQLFFDAKQLVVLGYTL